MLTVNVGE